MDFSDDTLRIEHPYYKLKYLFGLMGANSLIVQVILFRELFVTFSGNELSWGVFFATWLIAGALGSYTYTGLKLNIEDKKKALYFAFIFISFLLFVEIIVVRIIKTKLGFAPNEILPIEEIFLITSLIISLPPFLFGAMFSMIIDFTSGVLEEDRIKISGMVYSFEALGSFIAGILFSFVLVTFFTSIEISIILFLIDLIYGYFLLNKDFLLSDQPFYIIPKRLLYKGIIISSISILVLFLLFSAGILKRISAYSYEVQWKGFNFIKQVESKYGKITVTEKAEQYNFFQNSNLSFILPDTSGAEERIHLVMSFHENPKTVLLLGGLSDEIKELFKYDLDRLTFVELDPMLTDTVSEYIRHDDSIYFKENKIKTYFTDTRKFIKSTDEKYDVIILNSGEPNTLFANRYFTGEFYEEVKGRLSEKGLFSFTLPSSKNYLSGAMYFMQSSVYKTLSSAFKNIRLISSDSLTFLASDDMNLDNIDVTTLFQRFSLRELGNLYFNEYLLLDLIENKKNKERKDLLTNNTNNIVNSDFNPKTYMLGILLQGEESGSTITKMFKWFFFNERKDDLLYVLIGVFLIIFVFDLLSLKRDNKLDIYLVVSSSGMVSISVEILLLFIFQILFGYVYYKIGSLIAIFMLGLFFGGIIGNHFFLKKERRQLIYLIASEFILLAYLIITSKLLTKKHIGFLLNNNVYIFVLLFFAAFLNGIQFPIANSIIIRNGNKEDDGASYYKTGGRLYAADLSGACLGSIMVTLFLIPFYGIKNALIFLIILKLFTSTVLSSRLVLNGTKKSR